MLITNEERQKVRDASEFIEFKLKNIWQLLETKDLEKNCYLHLLALERIKNTIWKMQNEIAQAHDSTSAMSYDKELKKHGLDI